MKTPFQPTALFAVAVAAAMHVGSANADQVISQDLIVTGRLCSGGGCANGEPFNASSLRLKGDDLRLDFLDTSVSSRPHRDWRIEANAPAAGGAWYLAFKDLGEEATGVAGGTPILQLFAGAPANSLVVRANGRVGMGTASPGKDLHIVNGSSPTIRLHQNTSESRALRVWDIGGNELGFFVNDVVGATTKTVLGLAAGAPAGSLLVAPNGNVGIGVAPTARLHTLGTVRFSGLPSCASGIKSDSSGLLSCITSSRRFKDVTGDLSAQVALANVMALQPKVGSYTETPSEPEHWLIAEEAAEVDPAFVGLRDGVPYTVKTQNIVADLVSVIQHQQQIIEDQERRLAALERAIAN